MYVRPFHGRGGRWQVSEAAILCGPETAVNCFVGAPGQRLMAVSYTSTNNDGGRLVCGREAPGVDGGQPAATRSRQLRSGAGCNRRTAMPKDDVTAEKSPTHLTFLLNFFDELRRGAPAGK